VPYFHVVYTLPAVIGDIAYQSKAVIYDLLFKASAETTLTIAADPRHLGARIGFMSVLHTWGSALTHHPHVHMVVPGGGLSRDGSKWIACRPCYFLTVEVLSALFRRLFLQMLVVAHHAGRLQFFGDHAGRPTPHAATTVPMLRRTYVHHRDLRARQRAKAPTHARAGRDQDRPLMMLSSLIQHRSEASHFGRLSPGSTPACADQQDCP
jgi:hypothetical protein